MRLSVLILALAGVPLAAQDGVFRLEGAGAALRVSADRNPIAADEALRALAQAMGWRVHFESERLATQLSYNPLDLSFERQDPRVIAHLIATASDADVAFDDRTAEGQGSTVLHVISPPSPATEPGRRRLRQWAMTWYTSFLAKDLAAEPLVREEAVAVRMNLGQLMLQLGELEGAVKVFQDLVEHDKAHPYVPRALLRLAQAHFELQQYREAETVARELARLHPNLPETAAGVVLMGRVLLAQRRQDRYDEAVKFLEAYLLPLSGTPELVDVFLLIGDAHRMRKRPDRTLATMEQLVRTRSWQEMSERQVVDYLFLRGYGAEGDGRHAEGAEALELFVGLAPDDPRRAAAFVLLGRCYLGLSRYLEARAAALEAKGLASTLADEDSRQELRFLDANTLLALGERDKAFEDLEIVVRKDPEQKQEQILFLIEQLTRAGFYQRAISAAELLRDVRSPVADRVRVAGVAARLRQARQSGGLEAFPAQAIDVAGRIADSDLQSQVARWIGEAYEELNDPQRAADAYRGILR
ncbi:MAG: tetratricopeptide repeat protein [Planctomycetes bacterium]|nr:tetratricopeptide repeat protein [Planctomycetota bacterium]